jgi:hypothetical protein
MTFANKEDFLCSKCWQEVNDFVDYNDDIINILRTYGEKYGEISYRQPLTTSARNHAIEMLFYVAQKLSINKNPLSGRIWFEYHTSSPRTNRNVDLKSIFTWNGNNYFLGLCNIEGTEKTFRFDRCHDVRFRGNEFPTGLEASSRIYHDFFQGIKKLPLDLFCHPKLLASLASGGLHISFVTRANALNIQQTWKILLYFLRLSMASGSWADYRGIDQAIAALVVIERFDMIKSIPYLRKVNLKTQRFPFNALTAAVRKIDELI